ncbi:hypothetical protein ABR33_22420 [Enterobacter bugandensis]|nr:hypothetical protein ABR33_22420 [Enterobacter bugandensis]
MYYLQRHMQHISLLYVMIYLLFYMIKMAGTWGKVHHFTFQNLMVFLLMPFFFRGIFLEKNLFQ